jgi:pachytene checkpoint protein 2
LILDEAEKTNGIVTYSQCDFDIFVFQYNEEGEGEEATEEEENLPAYSEWILPNIDFHGLWESLIFEKEVKNNLLEYR